jgi:hypothetical protein
MNWALPVRVTSSSAPRSVHSSCHVVRVFDPRVVHGVEPIAIGCCLQYWAYVYSCSGLPLRLRYAIRSGRALPDHR